MQMIVVEDFHVMAIIIYRNQSNYYQQYVSFFAQQILKKVEQCLAERSEQTQILLFWVLDIWDCEAGDVVEYEKAEGNSHLLS